MTAATAAASPRTGESGRPSLPVCQWPHQGTAEGHFALGAFCDLAPPPAAAVARLVLRVGALRIQGPSSLLGLWLLVEDDFLIGLGLLKDSEADRCKHMERRGCNESMVKGMIK